MALKLRAELHADRKTCTITIVDGNEGHIGPPKWRFDTKDEHINFVLPMRSAPFEYRADKWGIIKEGVAEYNRQQEVLRAKTHKDKS